MSPKKKIYENLRYRIITNAFGAGQQLYEKELMQTYQIGRTPLREVFQELRQKSPVQWAEIIAALGGEMASQVRFLIERYRQCLAWNLQISAGSEISLASLAELSMEISITLIDGSSLRGRVLNVEKDTAAGWDMLFGADDGSLRIIPRHAVVQIMARQGNDDPVSG